MFELRQTCFSVDHNPKNKSRYRGYKPTEAEVEDGAPETMEFGGFDRSEVPAEKDTNENEIIRAKDVLEGGNEWPKPMVEGEAEEIAQFEWIVRRHYNLLTEVSRGR